MQVLKVNDLKTYYMTYQGAVKAVDGVSFEVGENEFVGLVGESGCGKSTIAYSIMGLLSEPGRVVDGNILFKGNNILKLDKKSMAKIRGKDISMVFQQSMSALNPVIKVGEQIREAITRHKERIAHVDSRKEIFESVKELIKLVGLDERCIKNYPFELSGGMNQRAIIAMALSCEPTLIIADEPTTALDVTIQAQIMDLFKALRLKHKMSLLLITHDLSVVAETCDTVMIMYAGKIVEKGDISSIFKNPGHPYTKFLIGSIPSMERGKTKKLVSIPGRPPDLLNPPPGCRFYDRCPFAKDVCRIESPKLEDHGGIACFFADELKDASIEKLSGEAV